MTTRLCVNFHKSTIREIGVCERDILRFAILLNCFTLEMPFGDSTRSFSEEDSNLGIGATN